MSYALGLVLGVAILAAHYLLETMGFLPVMTNMTVGLFIFLFLQRPFTTLYVAPYRLYHLKKQAGFRTKQSFFSLLALCSIILSALAITLYLNALRTPQRTALEQWLVFGGSDTKSVLACIGEELKLLWIDGVPVLAWAKLIYELYKPLCVAAFSRPAVFWYTVLPFSLIFSALDWISCIYVDYSQLLDEGLNEDLGIQGRPAFHQWAISRVLFSFAGVKVLEAPTTYPVRGLLGEALPKRQGERPTLRGMTQRQVDQLTPPHLMASIDALTDAVVAATRKDRPADARFAFKPSFLEGGLRAIRRNLDGQTDADVGGPADVGGSFNGADEFGGEVFHPRRDGTSLVVLHPGDVRAVLEAGLGERHLLACGNLSWRFFFHSILGSRCPFPVGSVILYAPRDRGELEALRDIVSAAIGNEADKARFTSSAHSGATCCLYYG